ncbi:MAG: polysaccharide pyruvyl transferase family protein [Candidatus Omnitrophica bacterium]|nr:polysaccharide pyruvyl transferase family protein [Candidatus Omnitrophota bacterium]
MKKKIGILTYHHVINEGAVLQAYSLAQNLKRLLPDDTVEVIDYRPFSVELYYLLTSFIARDFSYVFDKIRRYILIKRFIKTMLPLTNTKLISNNYSKAIKFIRSHRYDCIIVGSDEIWKIGKFAPYRPFPNAYWLNKDLSCCKIAYAASANRTAYKKLTPEQIQFIRESLGVFTAITVRDEHTIKMLAKFGLTNQKNISIAPDPTFMLDIPDMDLKQKLSRLGIACDKPLVGIVVTKKDISDLLVKYFKERGFLTLAISCSIKKADFNLSGKLDIFEWANIFKYMSFCVTERFHPAIFSMRFGTPFLAIDYEKHYNDYGSKIGYLLSSMSLNDHYHNLLGSGEWRNDIIKKLSSLLKHADRNILLEKFNKQKITAIDIVSNLFL